MPDACSRRVLYAAARGFFVLFLSAMQCTRIKKPDGRYLLLYDFAATGASRSRASAPAAPVASADPSPASPSSGSRPVRKKPRRPR